MLGIMKGEEESKRMKGEGRGEFVTVVSVDSGGGVIEEDKERGFVTVLSVGGKSSGESQDEEEDGLGVESVEEEDRGKEESVLVYRLPGERLGFGLKFEGGVKTSDNVSKVWIQSCAGDSPASRAKASWGSLESGDEIISVDGSPVCQMTRLDCVRALKESSLVMELRVRRRRRRRRRRKKKRRRKREEERGSLPLPPPVPPRKTGGGSLVTSLITPPPQIPPKPVPRREEKRRPPQPHQPPTHHLPRLIDFLPKGNHPDQFTTTQLQPNPFKEKDGMNSNNSIIQGFKEHEDGKSKYRSRIIRQLPDENEYTSKTCAPSEKLHVENVQISKNEIREKYVSSNNCGSSTSENSNIYKNNTYRNDEKSKQSVKDKIAMFSCSVAEVPLTKHLRLNKPFKLEIVNNNIEQHDERSNFIQHNLNTLIPNSFRDVSLSNGNIMIFPQDYDKKQTDLKEVDYTLSPINDSERVCPSTNLSLEYSTLPKNIGSGISKQQEKDQTKPKLTRALSFTGLPKMHSRSQSLVDINQNPCYSSKVNCKDICRKSSLSTLIEQRRKTMSKLRGLIIPAQVTDVGQPQQYLDLPEIRMKGPLPSTQTIDDRRISLKSDVSLPLNSSASYVMATPPWKAEDSLCNLPKYSPAFKRKPFSILNTSSRGSSVSSSLNSSREDLKSCSNEISKVGAIFPKIGSQKVLGTTSPKIGSQKVLGTTSSTNYLDAQSSTNKIISSNSSEFINVQNTNNDKLKGFKQEEAMEGGNKSRAESRINSEDSDNDSAVSSSPSSISHGVSPPLSPYSEPSKYYNEHKTLSRSDSNSSGTQTLKRSLSSETTTSSSSSGSTLTPDSKSSCGNTLNTQNSDNKRVLKPQSIEAINRKNVVSSARFSSGQDWKFNPPLSNVYQSEKDKEKVPDSNLLIKCINYQSQDTYTIAQTESTYSLSKGNSENVLNIWDSSSLHENVILDITKDEHVEAKESSSCNKQPKNISNIDGLEPKGKNNFYFDDAGNKIPFSGRESLSLKNIIPTVSESLINETSNHIDTLKPSNSRASVSVNDIKKAFEKAEIVLAPSGRLRNTNFNSNIQEQHLRGSSVDSTHSDDSFVRISTAYGSVSDLQKEQQFGSITSLASSTSLISQQELSQLIEESNHNLEDGGCSQEVVVVVLHRDTECGSIGITLAGGSDCEAKEITVHKVLSGSPAEKDGRVQKGDRILSINGKSMKGLTHQESLGILKAPRPEVVLVVSRNKLDSEEDLHQTSKNLGSSHPALTTGKGFEVRWGPIVTVTLIKDKDGAGLGFSLEGGKNSPFGDQLLTVKKIFTGGYAEKSGCLFAGDELISVNNVDLSGLSRIEAWALMKKLPDGEVHLNVRHPI